MTRRRSSYQRPHHDADGLTIGMFIAGSLLASMLLATIILNMAAAVTL